MLKTKEALLSEQDLFGGAEGTRTPDPLHAMQVRYQLRHRPRRCFLTARSNLNRVLHTVLTAPIRPCAPGGSHVPERPEQRRSLIC